MCHGPLRFCNDLHVLKVDPYHVEQPLKQFWSCLNDWNLFSIVGQRLLKNVIYDLWKSASPEAFYSPLFAVVHYFFDRVYVRKSRGPRTVPCGTPDNTCSRLDLAPFRKASIQLLTFPRTPQQSSLYSNLEWEILSKAFSKSSRITSTWLPS